MPRRAVGPCALGLLLASCGQGEAIDLEIAFAVDTDPTCVWNTPAPTDRTRAFTFALLDATELDAVGEEECADVDLPIEAEATVAYLRGRKYLVRGVSPNPPTRLLIESYTAACPPDATRWLGCTLTEPIPPPDGRRSLIGTTLCPDKCMALRR